MGNDSKGCFLVISFVLLVLGLICFDVFWSTANPQYHVGVVTNAYTFHSGESDSYHVAMDLDDGGTETYQVKDSLWNGQWDSANKFAQLKTGSHVRVKTVGWRWPWFSWFPNIIEVNKEGK